MITTLELLPTLELVIDPVAQRHHLTEWIPAFDFGEHSEPLAHRRVDTVAHRMGVRRCRLGRACLAYFINANSHQPFNSTLAPRGANVSIACFPWGESLIPLHPSAA
jgi:hypothetical protein